MIIVVDANIIIMALMGSRATGVILTSQNHVFYTPAKIIEKEFEEGMEALLKFIQILEYIEYEAYVQSSKKMIFHRDPTDVDYLACALAVNADFIWSNDKDFTAQEIISVKTTSVFIKEGKV
jgi:predicted nucleic acid-binding protein